MQNIAIRTEGLSKRYRIGARPFANSREWLERGLARLRSRAGPKPPGAGSDFWALRDVSLEIGHGEVVGLIGRNGAGKSTLLKILSRITRPTAGHAEVRGRMGSLLEVGTGFHPELTGRENIFLNGAILGMTRPEIRRKFDEIVAYAEIEKFLGTPVKRYSSGMYVRLAFAIAAHLEPDILIVDEVLAVGDSAFQQKCLGKMKEVARQGRTVVLVSHTLPVISNLCTKVFWMSRGQIEQEGDASEVVRAYLESGHASLEFDLAGNADLDTLGLSCLRRARLLTGGQPTRTISSGDSFELEVECRVAPERARSIALGFAVEDSAGQSLFASNMQQYGIYHQNREGHVIFRARIDRFPFAPGTYSLSLYLGNSQFDFETAEAAVRFEVAWTPGPDIQAPPDPAWGPISIPVRWDVEPVPAGDS